MVAFFFLFLHSYDVHCPYDPDESLARQFRSPDVEPIEVRGRCGNPHFNSTELTQGQVRFLSDNYDASIRQADADIGAFLQWLESSGLSDDTIVLITSDHGVGDRASDGGERASQVQEYQGHPEAQPPAGVRVWRLQNSIPPSNRM